MTIATNSRHASSNSAANTTAQPALATPPTDPWLAVVAEKVRGVNFGIVQIVIHDSKVVQIERTERTRFEVPQSLHSR